jgi:hypothetical protein
LAADSDSRLDDGLKDRSAVGVERFRRRMVKEADLVNSLSTDQMKALAREGARVRLQELEAEVAALERLLRDSGAATRPRERAARTRTRRRGQLSAAGRAAIAAAQKARWAKVKSATSTAEPATETVARPAAARPRRQSAMSAAARKAVGDRMRKYWAERRKASAKQAGAKNASATAKR